MVELVELHPFNLFYSKLGYFKVTAVSVLAERFLVLPNQVAPPESAVFVFCLFYFCKYNYVQRKYLPVSCFNKITECWQFLWHWMRSFKLCLINTSLGVNQFIPGFITVTLLWGHRCQKSFFFFFYFFNSVSFQSYLQLSGFCIQ